MRSYHEGQMYTCTKSPYTLERALPPMDRLPSLLQLATQAAASPVRYVCPHPREPAPLQVTRHSASCAKHCAEWKPVRTVPSWAVLCACLCKRQSIVHALQVLEERNPCVLPCHHRRLHRGHDFLSLGSQSRATV